MKKVLVFLFCALWGTVLYGQTLDSAVLDSVQYLKERFPRGTRTAVMVVESPNLRLSDLVERKLNAALVNSGWFTVVERNEAALSTIDRETVYQLSGYVSDETSLAIGKQLGAQLLVLGSFNRGNQGLRLEVKALVVETAQVGGLYTTKDIFDDPQFASLADTLAASVSFVGMALTEYEQGYLLNALRSGFAGQKPSWPVKSPSFEFGDSAAGRAAPYSFVISVTGSDLPPQPPVNTPLLQGSVSISFTYKGRVIEKAGPYEVIEMTQNMIARRSAERLAQDTAFFRKVILSVSR